MLVKPVSLVPRNPADSWGIAESDDKEAETKSETARHAAPVQKAAAEHIADRCRPAIKRPKLPGTLCQLTAQQQTVSQIGAGSAIKRPKLPGTLGQLTIQEEELWKASKHAKLPKLPKGLSQ